MINFTEGTVNKSKLISRRMFTLTVAKFIIFGGIFGRLVSLQINEFKKYRTLSDKIGLENGDLPQRGVIKDYFDNEIALIKEFINFITPEMHLILKDYFSEFKVF